MIQRALRSWFLPRGIRARGRALDLIAWEWLCVRRERRRERLWLIGDVFFRRRLAKIRERMWRRGT